MRKRENIIGEKIDYLENGSRLEVKIFTKCRAGSKESKTVIFSKKGLCRPRPLLKITAYFYFFFFLNRNHFSDSRFFP